MDARRRLADHAVAMALFTGGLAVAIAAVGIEPAADGDRGAQLFPLIGAVLLMLTGVGESLSARRRPAVNRTRHRHHGPVVALAVLSLCYVWSIAQTSYLLSTAIALPLALRLFGVRHPGVLWAGALLLPALYHLVFFVGLGLFPPSGKLVDVADYLPGAR